MNYNETIAIENFIDFCNEMQIATEAQGNFQKVIDWLVETFTKLYETIHSAVLSFKKKMAGSKHIKIPKHYHKNITYFTRLIYGIWKGKAEELTDERLEGISTQWAKIKNSYTAEVKQMKKDKEEFEEQSAIPVSEIYSTMITSSKIISDSLNFAKNIRSKIKNLKNDDEIAEAQEHIHRLKNQVKLARILSDIDRFYLSFPSISAKHVGPENPDTQVVTQEERDGKLKED